jgi:hypothetical protein
MSSFLKPLGRVSLGSSIGAAFIIAAVGFGVHEIVDLPVLGFLVKWLNPLCIYDAIQGESGKCSSDKGYAVVIMTYSLILSTLFLVPSLAQMLPVSSLVIAAIISFITMLIMRKYFPKVSENQTVAISLGAGALTVPSGILIYKAIRAKAKRDKLEARAAALASPLTTADE